MITKQSFKYVTDPMMNLTWLFHPILNLFKQLRLSQILILDKILAIEIPLLYFIPLEMSLKTLK